MDPLSHVVIGRALIAAVGDDTDRLGRGVGAAAVLGALAPDVDALMVPFGWDIYLRAHEIGTHSVVGAFLVGGASGLIVAALARVLVRRGRPDLRQFALAGIVGALSHIALDLVCGARIRLAWPFAEGRVALPLIAMADPWFVAMCVVALVAVVAARRHLRIIARTLLVAEISLLCVKGVMLQRVRHSSPVRFTSLSAFEARFGSLTEWHEYERLPDAIRAWRLDGRRRASTVVLLEPLGADPPLVAASRSLDTVRNFMRTHEFGFPRERTIGDETSVVWSDIRYCWNDTPGRPIACALWFGGVFGPDGRVLRQQVQVGRWVQTRPFSP